MENKKIIGWKSDVELYPISKLFPKGLDEDVISCDIAHDVFVMLTDKSYTDGEYIYNICSVDYRAKDSTHIVTWHKKLAIYDCIPSFLWQCHLSIKVHNRKIYIDRMLKTLQNNK